ncbi:hypothetical protein HHK36_029895 [Tetracentron sinense]|uniref:Sulfotransferase n=1 Tax=Tetracentron sinense TaxID=13715 RepID=A0A835D009_TETSI|nr:hypothetical protein HHK36_029895 [Tetracentron sinense]
MATSKFHSLFSATLSNSLDHLPRKKWWGYDVHQWEGFWYLPSNLEAAIAARSHFEACSDDVVLASSMKTGTTWLKALIPSIMNLCGDDDNDPLIQNHPNALIPSFDVQLYKQNPPPDLSTMPFPRLFRTHMPYHVLPESIKSSDCKIVYITRNPKDTFVSLWHFMNTTRTPEQGPFPMLEAFESFCNGVHAYGPFHDHVLGYWKESLKRSQKILFLKYEEMKKEPRAQLKRLASFLERPFVKEEDVDKVLWRCSLDRLKNLEVNKNGVDPWVGMPHSSYFRLGNVGYWNNYFTTKMNERLDQITRIKLEGSGLDLAN